MINSKKIKGSDEVYISTEIKRYASNAGAQEEASKGALIYALVLRARGHSIFYSLDKAKTWLKLIIETE